MDLSIIIVNYKTSELVKACVTSIKKYPPKTSYEIIVRDNSVDNVGFAKGVNLGIKKAKGGYILLLNSDTLVKKGSLDKLLEFAKSRSDAGVIGARLLNKDGSLQESASHSPTIWSAMREYWFGEKGNFGLYAPKSGMPTEVDSVVGAAFLITPQALKKVGGLNDKYFMYFEDLDYCRKVKRAGLKVYYLPEAEVIHYLGASGKNIAVSDNQWRRLIPASKIYHGTVVHNLINFILWTGQKFGKIIPALLLTLLTVPAFFNLLRPGFFPMQDDLQAFRVYEMDRCYDDFQIPCRWVPDAGYQYGYPQFNFYPPLPYYIGALLHRVGIQYIDSVKILFILGYILSAITIFILVSELTDKWSGFVSALLYTYIPYKAVEVYVRGALSEFWAQIFFPL
ncbi:MAG: glycosyltransferase, partial [Patescibacteria group bacterium]